jgi:methyl coenzyme M reductase subunit C
VCEVVVGCVPLLTLLQNFHVLVLNFKSDITKCYSVHQCHIGSVQESLVCRPGVSCMKCDVLKCVCVCMDAVSATPWADSAARTRAPRPAQPDPCSGSTTASSSTTSERAKIHSVLCLPCRTICPTAAVSVATRRNSR